MKPLTIWLKEEDREIIKKKSTSLRQNMSAYARTALLKEAGIIQ